MMESTEAGPELGFEYEPAEAVTDAVIERLETKKIEVIRGREARSAMIAANREHPQEVDAQLSQMKAEAEQVSRSLKVFKIVSERYRNRHQRLRFILIAGIYNSERVLT